MTEDNWEKIQFELKELNEEFNAKHRLSINDLKFNKRVVENEKRVTEIIDSFITIVKRHEILYQAIFDEKDEYYKTYMELGGLRKEIEFSHYSDKVIRKLEEILK
jgi:hypothetical protein